MKGLMLSLIAVIFVFFGLFFFEHSKAQVVIPENVPEQDLLRNESFDRFIALAREKGPVRVIVGLRIENFGSFGRMDEAQRHEQESVLRQNQNAFLERLNASNAGQVKLFSFIPFLAIEADAGTLQKIKDDPAVFSIEEDDLMAPNLAESVPLVGGTAAWSSGFSGKGWAIAILDTGVDKSHPFLTGKVVSEACYSTTSSGMSSASVCPGAVSQSIAANSGLNCSASISGCHHGTHVAGIAAGRGASSSGVAKDANIISIQVFSSISDAGECDKEPAPCARSHRSDQLLGLERVMALSSSMNIASVNMSLGGGENHTGCDGGKNQAYAFAMRNLYDVGIATVVSSGNDGYTSAIGFPACISYAVSVGSVGDGSGGSTVNVVESDSNSAQILSLLAPGSLITSSVPGGGTLGLSGTSMAAPHVAGAWAVIKQRVPSASVPQILNALTSTGLPVTDARSGLVKPRIRIDAALPTLNGGVSNEIKIIGSESTIQSGFGASVAVSGDTAVIGNPGNGGSPGTVSGSAYVFVRNANGTWSQQAKLFATDDSAPPNGFGTNVAISGNTVIVGAYRDNVGANVDQGSAYVFVRNGTTWTQQAKLVSSDGAAQDQFGYRLALSENTAVVSSIRDDSGTVTDHGSIYVFVRNGATWTQQQKVLGNDTAANDLFGISVAISGNTIISGAYFDDIGVNSNQGSAYIFVRNGTTWTQQQKLTSSDGPIAPGFGYSVALEGETAVVGKLTGIPLIPPTIEGGAYVFVRNGTVWTQQQKLLASDGVTNTRFGESTAISGNKITIGALGDDIGANSGQGSASIFAKIGNRWVQQRKLTSSDGAIGDGFGLSTAMWGNSLIIGTPGDDNERGSAYIYTTPNLRSAPFDYDGDGKADLSVFRPSTGVWYVQNSSNNSFAINQFGSNGDQPVPGDFDNDGKIDIAIYRPSNGLWYWVNSATGTVGGNQFGTGADMPIPGDYDGDGKADITIFRPSTGTWWTYRSSDNGVSATQFGISGDRPTSGDFDGDGKADLAVFRSSNATWYRLNSSSGAFVVVNFGATGDKPVPADYDGDGKTDVAVYRPSNGGWYWVNSAAGTVGGNTFGVSEDRPSPGDYDGDGKADLAVFRPSQGIWYLLRTTAGFTAQSFGTAGDIPTPNSFIQ